MNLTLTRLILLSGEGAWKRLIGIASGIAVGVALFLTLWGAATGLEDRDERTTWMRPDDAVAQVDAEPTQITDDTVLFSRDTDYFRGLAVIRIGLAATPTSTIELPGGVPIPGPREYLASPALLELMEAVPRDQLSDRFGAPAGELPPSLLSGPDSLIIIEGYDEAALRELRSTSVIAGFDGPEAGANSEYRMILLIGSIAVFLPVILLVSIVTQLGAVQRSERFSTLRLIGAAPRSLSQMAAIEMAITSLVGSLAGVALAWALRPLAALIVINDTRFFSTDLDPGVIVTASAVAAMVAGSAFAAAHRTRRAGIGPLGATRQAHERRPRFIRVIPLLLGVAITAWATQSPDTLATTVIGFAMTAIGLLTSGPWFVWAISTMLAERVRSAPSVIAANRIRRSPAAVFRSVSGLVLAVFVASMFAGAASVEVEMARAQPGPGLLPLDAVYVNLKTDPSPGEVQEVIAPIDGVTGYVLAFGAGEEAETGIETLVVTASDAEVLGFEEIPASDFVSFDRRSFLSAAPDEAAVLVPADPPGDNPDTIFVRSDGHSNSIERVQTAMVASGLTALTPPTRTDLADLGSASLINSLASLAYLGIAIAVGTAGISLAVATVAAILDRRRVIGLMRLMGMPAAALRRIVAYESITPLMATLAIAIGLGFFVAWRAISALPGNLSMNWPDPRYFATLAVSLALAISAVFATFGTIRKNTTILSTRFE